MGPGKYSVTKLRMWKVARQLIFFNRKPNSFCTYQYEWGALKPCTSTLGCSSAARKLPGPLQAGEQPPHGPAVWAHCSHTATARALRWERAQEQKITGSLGLGKTIAIPTANTNPPTGHIPQSHLSTRLPRWAHFPGQPVPRHSFW